MAAVSTRMEFTGDSRLGEDVCADTWLTPRYILDQLGKFDLDPCAASGNPNWVAARSFTYLDDGLNQDWTGRVFMNPPFSNTVPWLAKHAGHANGISLVPASVESRIWREVVWPCAKGILFLHGRTRFCNPDGSTTQGRPLRSVVLIGWTEEDAAIIADSPLAGVFTWGWSQK